MASMPHKDLLRQLGLIEDAVKRTQSATVGLKAAFAAGVGEGYATGQRERLKKECTLLIGLMNQFADSLKNAIVECDTMLNWFMTLPKSDQRKSLTSYGSPQLAASLDSAKSYANKLIPKVKTYLRAFLRCTAKPYPDAPEVAGLINSLMADVEIVSLTKLIVEDIEKAKDLQFALAPEFKGAKERGGSWLARLFGFKPKPAYAR
jgi:hypothetical protein